MSGIQVGGICRRHRNPRSSNIHRKNIGTRRHSQSCSRNGYSRRLRIPRPSVLAWACDLGWVSSLGKERRWTRVLWRERDGRTGMGRDDQMPGGRLRLSSS